MRVVSRRNINRFIFISLLAALLLWYVFEQNGFMRGFIRHIHGGFVSGYLIYYLFRRTPLKICFFIKLIQKKFNSKIFLKIRSMRMVSMEFFIYLLLVIFIGVAVEFFEFMVICFGGNFRSWDMIDTSYDLLADIIGGSLFYFFIFSKKNM